MWSAEFGKVASAPRSSSLSFFPIFVPSSWTECFRGFPCLAAVVCFTFCSGPTAIFILMPDLPFRLGDLCRQCPELHRQFRPMPCLHSRRRYLTYRKTAAHQKRLHPQLPTRLQDRKSTRLNSSHVKI